MRGRKPSGPAAVARLPGSPLARQRLQAVLETLAGTCRVQEACRRLGLSEQRFDQLRAQALQAGLDALEPRPGGRRGRRRPPTWRPCRRGSPSWRSSCGPPGSARRSPWRCRRSP